LIAYLARTRGKRHFLLSSAAGDIRGEALSQDETSVQQGKVSELGPPIDLSEFGHGLKMGFPVSVGNPHLVVPMEAEYHSDFENNTSASRNAKIPKLSEEVLLNKHENEKIIVTSKDLEKLGSVLERHTFFPERTNVEFCWSTEKSLRIIIWERGAGRTAACGSGACAAAFILGSKDSETMVSMDGGDLKVKLTGEGFVTHTGQAEWVFSGIYRVPKGLGVFVNMQK